jgi:hypothetical protein
LLYPYARVFTTLSLIAVDALGLFVSMASVLLFWSQIRADLEPARYLSLLPVLLIFIIAYYLAGLYPGIGISPIEELRRLTTATAMVYLILAALSFLLRNVEQFSRASFLLSWLVAFLVLPAGRHIREAKWAQPSGGASLWRSWGLASKGTVY